MKKLWVLPAAALLLALTACAAGSAPAAVSEAPPKAAESRFETQSADAPESESTDAEETEPENKGEAGEENRVLVVWFSRVGVTPFDPDEVDAVASASVNIRDGRLVGNVQYLAEYIAAATGGELHQIVTEKEYPTDYRETTDLASEEQSADERPALTSRVENMERYDVIFVGYPNWWGTLPQAVKTFLAEYDLSGKTLVPFCSHGGSALGRGPAEIAALCPDATLLEGLAVEANDVSAAQDEVESWLTALGLMG